MNIFEQAARIGLRFESPRGLMTVEDLFKLPLTGSSSQVSLNSLGLPIQKQLRESQEDSLVFENPTQNSQNKILNLRLDIIKYIIKTKQIEIAEKEAKEAHLSEIRKIDAVIASKKDNALENLSIEQLEALKKSKQAI